MHELTSLQGVSGQIGALSPTSLLTFVFLGWMFFAVFRTAPPQLCKRCITPRTKRLVGNPVYRLWASCVQLACAQLAHGLCTGLSIEPQGVIHGLHDCCPLPLPFALALPAGNVVLCWRPSAARQFEQIHPGRWADHVFGND